MKLTGGQKAFLVVFCFGLAIVGFMIKLPSAFRHVDKELHALFYFLAAAFLNILFAGNKILRHILIFIILLLLGIAIEYVQEYSNTFLRKRIHGRFDPEDIKWNVRGLIAFSVLWIIYISFRFVFRKTGNDKTA
jgi:hypothetical protein